eukprot:3479611-Amphidinium_carterae.1
MKAGCGWNASVKRKVSIKLLKVKSMMPSRPLPNHWTQSCAFLFMPVYRHVATTQLTEETVEQPAGQEEMK